ncbi:unnamed protein product, partial [Rotaria sp. Silwood1]
MGITTSKTADTKSQSKSIENILHIQQRTFSSIEDEKVEIFTLIWFDERSNDTSLDSLIISGSFARKYLSTIHEQIASIIIFCGIYNKYVDLLDTYSNIMDICTEHHSLKSSIERELPSLNFNLFQNQTLKSVRSISSSSSVHNYCNRSAYFSYLSFMEILKHMSQTEEAKQIMINQCKGYYRRNKIELEKIELFRNTYTFDKAIDWYTLDSFVYRLVNHAFRTEDIAL